MDFEQELVKLEQDFEARLNARSDLIVKLIEQQHKDLALQAKGIRRYADDMFGTIERVKIFRDSLARHFKTEDVVIKEVLRGEASSCQKLHLSSHRMIIDGISGLIEWMEKQNTKKPEFEKKIFDMLCSFYAHHTESDEDLYRLLRDKIDLQDRINSKLADSR